KVRHDSLPGQRPDPFRYLSFCSLADQYSANMSPPTPVLSGSTAASVALAQIAASMAFPPRRSTSSAAAEASGWLVQTMPFFARTADRPGHWPGRERREELIGLP